MKQLIIRLDDEQHYLLKLKCTRDKIPMQEAVERLIKDFISDEKQNNETEYKKNNKSRV